MLVWIGIALLSVSWLVGLGYYHLANWPAWTATIVAGTFCLTGLGARLPAVGEATVALLFVLPACWLAPWPYRAALVLMAGGLALGLVIRPGVSCHGGGNGSLSKEAIPAATKKDSRPLWRLVRRLSGICERLSTGLTFAGYVLLAQALGIQAYMVVTSRSHELPGFLAAVLGAACKALGIDSAVYGSTLAAFSMRKIHYLGATWELLLDPVTWCFLVGGLVLVARRVQDSRPLRSLARMVAVFVLPVLVWLPLRAAILVAVYLHEVLRVDYDAPLQVMERFWSAPTHLILLAGPVLVAWRFVPLGPLGGGPVEVGAAERSPAALWRRPAAALLVLAGAAVFSIGILWDPVGERKAGRVVIEEYHPQGDKQWERTDKPFDTTWYGHLSGYNYYCIYDYMTRFYAVTRRTEPLNEAALKDCDVLIVKVPTRPFANHEIQAIERFVDGGGGLMLVGEHTNVFGSGTYLNSIARRFGFRFRYDCLFGVDKVFEQRFKRPMVPHPIVQHLPWVEFATSCSIDPQRTSGRGVMRSVGLKNLMADYHVSNFYPKPEDSPEMRYGAWIQLWSMRYGRGRIAAFTDSTIFSNFCVFEPGKKELWMGMVEWLNHQSPRVDPRWPLVGLGTLLVVLGFAAARRWAGAGLVMAAASVFGWSAAAVSVQAWHRDAMPYPDALRPYVQVNMDLTVCSPRLPRNGFISVTDTDYGIFERWILRLGYFLARRSHAEVLDGNLIVFLEPNRPVPPDFRADLVRFVEGGGKILIVDAPTSLGPRAPTTNELLQPFGISVDHSTKLGGPFAKLVSSEGWPSVPIHAAVVVQGGRPFAWVDGKPVGASISVGNRGGSVTVIGYGPRFREDQMGGTGDIEPDKSQDKTLTQVYEWEYRMLRAIVEGKPLGMAGPVETKP